MEAAQELRERGILFSRGAYVTMRTLGGLGYHIVPPPEGLLDLGQNTSKGGYTVNDTGIPTQVLQWSGLWQGPRRGVEGVKIEVRQIYREDRIAQLEQQLSLLEPGKENLDRIMEAILKGDIELPEGYSTSGVELVYGNAEFGIPGHRTNLSSQLEFLRETKELYDSLGMPERVAEILELDTHSLAARWYAKTIKPRAVR